MADYSGRVTKTAFSRSAGACPPQSPNPHENAPFAVARGPVSAQCQLSESGFSGCPRWSRIFKICKIHRIFLSPSVQDQAILRYREGWCGGGRRALLRLDSSSRRALLVSVRFRWTDAGEGQALALRYKGRCCGPVARGPVPRNANCLNQDFQDFQDEAPHDGEMLLQRTTLQVR